MDYTSLAASAATNEIFAVFAPIAAIIKYDTLDEAIDIANNTKYGLGASVFGPDQEKCVELVAKKLECGMVSINDFAVFYVSLLFILHAFLLTKYIIIAEVGCPACKREYRILTILQPGSALWRR